MEDSQEVSFLHLLRSKQFADMVDQQSKSQVSSKGERNRETFPVKIQAWKHCNCIRSRCLKLYCECFAAEIYCENCACQNCSNNTDYDDTVLDTRQQIELRSWKLDERWITQAQKGMQMQEDKMPKKVLRLLSS
ncbi:hypothetical protein V6Z11_D11G282900 [Gossypium hirsutum]